jgi:hypothetical protein
MPERRRVTRVAEYEQTSSSMKSYGHHRGVVHAIEFRPNRFVEVAHEARLLESGEVLLHERSKLVTECRNSASVAADVSKCNARDDAAWTEGDVVDIPTCMLRPCRNRMHPGRQSWYFDKAGRAFVAGPHLRTLKAARL